MRLFFGGENKEEEMIAFDIIWFGICAVYFYQLKERRGYFYEKMVSIASKKANFEEARFRRGQFIQVGIVTAIIVGTTIYRLSK
jgi:hypothetical protein